MILIDGSRGEGGGQILRSSLALSMATGRGFRMTGIRAGRDKPGLMRQHLACVRAAAAITSAEVTGDGVGSMEVTFSPGPIRAGAYHFAVGSAGGTSLVLQAVVPALLRADSASTIVVEGGTHNMDAPTFEFLERTLFPTIGRSGAGIQARLERHGFYPAGGGRVHVDIVPTRTPVPLHLHDRGERFGIRARAIVAGLPKEIAVREIGVLRKRLSLEEPDTQVYEAVGSAGPGNAVIVELDYKHIRETFAGMGQIGKSAETVAQQVAEEVRVYIGAQKPVGPYLADQLMVPLLLLGGGSYAATALTDHARTNIETINAFGGRVRIEAENRVCVEPLVTA